MTEERAGRASGGELSRRAREAVGLGQAAFARLIGVHNTTVWYWEQGQREPNRRMRTVLLLVAAMPEEALAILREETGEPRRRRIGRRRVLEAVCELGQGPLHVIPLDRLRASLADAKRDKLDQLLVAMEGEGRIALRPPLFVDCLNAKEREALLDHPTQGAVLFVALPEA